MKTVVYYDEPGGGTARLAEIIARTLPQNPPLRKITEEQPLADESLLFVGFEANKDTCSLETATFLAELSGRRVALFATAADPDTQGYYKKVLGRAALFLSDSNSLVGTFMCRGAKSETYKSQRRAQLLENPGEHALHAQMAAIEVAEGFPEAMEQIRAANFARDIFKKIFKD